MASTLSKHAKGAGLDNTSPNPKTVEIYKVYDVLNGLVNINESITVHTPMRADVLRVRTDGFVTIRMARTTAYAALVSLAPIAKTLGLRYVRFTFS